tara:strand:- start:342 stop:854 length:513 start_codon:yes stop_codon:yes gene_type:complete
MNTTLKLLYAVTITVLLVSCGGNSEEKIEETKIIDFSSMKTKIHTILADFEIEDDGIFHNATFDNKAVMLLGPIEDSETAINELVLNMQENPTSIKGNGEAPTLNASGNDYKLSTSADLVVGKNSYNATVYYNSDIYGTNGILEVDLNGTFVYLLFKGKKKKSRQIKTDK